MALVHGDPAAAARPLVHVHAACLLGDAFGSLACDCAAELAVATDEILAAGAGVIVYVKPGTADPERRYHCGREAPVDLAPVLALLAACGVEARRAELTPAGRGRPRSHIGLSALDRRLGSDGESPAGHDQSRLRPLSRAPEPRDRHPGGAVRASTS